MVPAERTDCSFLLARLHCGLAGNSRHTTVKSGRQIRMLVVLGVVVSAIGFFVLRPCDPFYRGKSLHDEHDAARQHAAEALKTIGRQTTGKAGVE